LNHAALQPGNHVIILVILWLLGAFVVPIGSNLVHLLLIVILAIVVVRLLRGQRPW
jgi:hypothetical protein